jgi:hypothetical protein
VVGEIPVCIVAVACPSVFQVERFCGIEDCWHRVLQVRVNSSAINLRLSKFDCAMPSIAIRREVHDGRKRSADLCGWSFV